MLGPCLVYPPRLPSAPVIPSRLPLLSTSLPDATAGTPTPAALKKARRGSYFRTAGWLRPRVVPAHSPASIAVAGHKSSPLTNATAPSTPPTPPLADYSLLQSTRGTSCWLLLLYRRHDDDVSHLSCRIHCFRSAIRLMHLTPPAASAMLLTPACDKLLAAARRLSNASRLSTHMPYSLLDAACSSFALRAVLRCSHLLIQSESARCSECMPWLSIASRLAPNCRTPRPLLRDL